MTPNLTRFYTRNSGLRYSKLSGNGALAFICISNRMNVICRKFYISAMITSASVLCSHIVYIILCSAEKQMTRINARGIVTMMKAQQSSLYTPPKQSPRNTMSKPFRHYFDTKFPVSFFVPASNPLPAFFGFVYAGVKDMYYFFNIFHANSLTNKRWGVYV